MREKGERFHQKFKSLSKRRTANPVILEDDGRTRVVVPRNRALKDTVNSNKTTQIQEAITTDLLPPNEADFRDPKWAVEFCIVELWKYQSKMIDVYFLITGIQVLYFTTTIVFIEGFLAG